MKTLSTKTIIFLSFLFGIIIWFVDAALDYFIFYEGTFFDLLILKTPQHEIYIRCVILALFIIFGLIIARTVSNLHKINAEKQTLVDELKIAMSEIKKLSGFLPICASCKKIRDDNGYWNQIELYIKEHSEAEFSHGICPECMEKLYPEYKD